MEKIADLCVKVGQYEKNGETKNRYLNVGAVMKGEKGQFIFLNRTFNPAGVPNPDNRDNVIVSIFKKENKNQAESTQEPVAWSE